MTVSFAVPQTKSTVSLMEGKPWFLNSALGGSAEGPWTHGGGGWGAGSACEGVRRGPNLLPAAPHRRHFL